jgi:hypothetical protein
MVIDQDFMSVGTNMAYIPNLIYLDAFKVNVLFSSNVVDYPTIDEIIATDNSLTSYPTRYESNVLRVQLGKYIPYDTNEWAAPSGVNDVTVDFKITCYTSETAVSAKAFLRLYMLINE